MNLSCLSKLMGNKIFLSVKSKEFDLTLANLGKIFKALNWGKIGAGH